MKKIALSFALLLIAICARSQSYGYVTATKLNVRMSPGTEYAKISELYKYDVFEVLSVDGNWVKVRFSMYDERRGDVVKDGYVSAAYVAQLQSSELPGVSRLSFSPAGDAKSDLGGFLELTRSSSGWDFDYRLYSKEMRRNGGTGTLDWGSGSTCVSDGKLYSLPEETIGNHEKLPVVYDASSRMLYFCGILWKRNK